MPIDTEPEKAGDIFFKRNEFDKAVRYFSLALVSALPSNTTTLLNKRAAAYLKLGDYTKAAADGISLFKQAPHAKDGYQRAAQAFQLAGKDEKAISILELGLKKMMPGTPKWNAVNAHFQSAKARHHRLLKRCDVLFKLPPEIRINIIERLDQRSKLRCIRVCRLWKRFIETNAQFFQALVIPKILIPPKSLRRWLTRTENSPYKLKKVNIALPEKAKWTNHSITSIGTVCKALEIMYLHADVDQNLTLDEISKLVPLRYKILTKIGMNYRIRITMKTAGALISQLPLLVVAQFDNVSTPGFTGLDTDMPHLKIIKLTSTIVVHRADDIDIQGALAQLMERAPNITSIHLVSFGSYPRPIQSPIDFAKWTKLKTLELTDTLLARTPVFPCTLGVLQLARVRLHFRLSMNDARLLNGTIDASKFYLPELVVLNVEASHFQTAMYEMSIAGLKSGTLKELYIGNTTHCSVDEDPYVDWPHRMPEPSESLAILHINELPHIDEDIVIRLLQGYPNLVEVDISSNPKLTGSVLRVLWDRDTSPRIVNIKGCDRIGRDAIETARRRGMELRQ